MKLLPSAVLLVALLLNGSIVGALPASDSCHKINATADGYLTPTGPSTIHSTATTSGGGLLQGTEDADFAFSVSFPFIVFAGPVTYTSNKGSVTANVAGSTNLITGEFSAEGDVTGGTGKLEGATGHLAIRGFENPDFSFSYDLTGSVCVDLSKKE